MIARGQSPTDRRRVRPPSARSSTRRTGCSSGCRCSSGRRTSGRRSANTFGMFSGPPSVAPKRCWKYCGFVDGCPLSEYGAASSAGGVEALEQRSANLIVAQPHRDRDRDRRTARRRSRRAPPRDPPGPPGPRPPDHPRAVRSPKPPSPNRPPKPNGALACALPSAVTDSAAVSAEKPGGSSGCAAASPESPGVSSSGRWTPSWSASSERL